MSCLPPNDFQTRSKAYQTVSDKRTSLEILIRFNFKFFDLLQLNFFLRANLSSSHFLAILQRLGNCTCMFLRYQRVASQRLLIANSTLWQPRDSLFSAPPQFHSIIYQNPHWYSAIPKTFTFYQTLSHISNTEIQLLSCKNFASPFYFINRGRNQSVGRRILKLKKKIKASRTANVNQLLKNT